MQSWELFLISAAYVALLFAIAYYGDRLAALGAPRSKPWVYSLALAVYATSWTFFGAVGRAAATGWDFLPIYLGPMLVFMFGSGLIRRIILASKRNNITSIADFIAARYGRHHGLAMLVTLIAALGVLPYIALQLKAVAFSIEVLAPAQSGAAVANNALIIAALLAVFAILFGTRQVVSTEKHHGMVLAIAFESLIKLVAFIAVGLYAVYGLYDGFGDAYASALALPQVINPPSEPSWIAGFFTQTLLAMAAIICLPRQFHVGVVENTTVEDLRTARWLFPAYLALISLFVLPIAAAGLSKLPHVLPDTYVLALPLADGQLGLALAAYIGGFSAATGMVIVETIALSTMICNELLLPLLLRTPQFRLAQQQDLGALIKLIRRGVIVLIIGLAYVYYRMFTGPGSLSSIGLLSFSAVLQFAPGVIGGVLWRRASYRGATTGLAVGFAVWFYTLLLPTLLTAVQGSEWLAQGPFGIEWLKPQALFGLSGLDLVTHATLFSLTTNLACYIGGSLLVPAGLRERLQASRFVGEPETAPEQGGDEVRISATVGDLQELMQRFLGKDSAQSALADFCAQKERSLPKPNDRAEPELVRYTERLLAGALGASSARLLLSNTLRGQDMQLEDVMRLLDDTSHVIQFNRELLRATLEHMSQGVSVVDADLRLVAWNHRYMKFFDYPPELITVGRPIGDLMRYNADRGLLGGGDLEKLIARRMEHMRAGHAYTHERELPDGTVIEIRGNPMPGGGFVTSYSDVTAYKQAQRELENVAATLETRVNQRTRELEGAKRETEKTMEAKTRFLATASHDLVQPLNAARLFISSLDHQTLPGQASGVIAQVENSLTSAESLIAGLLDISRLDANAQEIKAEHFEISRILDPLAAEFSALARRHGLQLSQVPSHQIVHTDPQLLRRVIQNFLSNATRYTPRGRILLGCRRLPAALRIEVWDTGPGIPQDKQKEIFEEFRRLRVNDAHGERGLGLGLAIADRIARMLDAPITLRSWLGRGSVFAITVPLGNRASLAPKRLPRRGTDRVEGSVVLILENEPTVLAGMEALLKSWGCRVIPARSGEEARQRFDQVREVPDLILIDYHLDDGANGVEEARQLQQLWGDTVPGIVVTADHTQEAKEQASQNGYALLPKPVKPAALRALMSRLLVQRGVYSSSSPGPGV